MNIQTVNQDLRVVMEVSAENLWFFQPVGEGGTIQEPKFKNNMWYYPLIDWDSTLDPEARQRVLAVAQKVPVAQVIIGHETPPLLPGKVYEKPKRKPIQLPSVEIPAIPWGTVGKALAFTGGLFVTVTSALFSALGFTILMGMALLVDPVVICVLEDGTWVKVYSWVE